jgi:phosphoglycolate phosphatase-like HAD superfamily hydrolase
MLIFHPQFMEFYQLWKIESFFREIAEYYNLFSVDRGCNRFIAIQLTLTALQNRKDVQQVLLKRHVKLLNIKPLNEYIAYTKAKDFALYKLLGWSEAVNRMFPHISAKIPPFDKVKECLELMSQHADILIVSKTPYADLANYWKAQGIDKYVQIIAGQEMGSKGHHIEVAKKAGKYKDDQVLMIGDGGGDLKAVKENNGLFYPTPPGQEQEAWNNFPEAFQRFIERKYKGEFEDKLLEAFKKSLLTSPPWQEDGYNHIRSYREKQEIRKALYSKLNPQGRLLVL